MSTYPGGKNGSGVYQKIINLMPPHKIYIEPFLGGGAIMRMKRRAPMANIGIDADAAVIQNWRGGAIDLVHGDALAWLRENGYVDRPDTLVYCDPPYLFETRKKRGDLYTVEFGDVDQHRHLLGILTSLPCMVMISGYWSTLYAQLLRDWRWIEFQAMTRGATMATEYVWLNFPQPLELHDYRYLGENFRERERIKRKQKRWRERLESMDEVERYAMLSVLENLRSPGSLDTSGDDCRRASPDGAMLSTTSADGDAAPFQVF